MINKNNTPIIVSESADNGEHSHFKLVDVETGDTLWSEEFNKVKEGIENLKEKIRKIREMREEGDYDLQTILYYIDEFLV